MIDISVENLEAGAEYIVGLYTFRRNGVYLTINKDNEEQEVKICELLFVEETIENIDTNEVFIKLIYKFKGEYKSLILPMDIINPNKLLSLLRFGVEIPPEDNKFLAKSLLKFVQHVEHKYIYKNVGWYIDSDGNMQYRLNEAISYANVFCKATNASKDPKYNLKCSGSLEDWVDMCKEEVIGNVELETALCFGFSAPIVGYLYRTRGYHDTLLIHLVGNSTTGKTTASNLAVDRKSVV